MNKNNRDFIVVALVLLNLFTLFKLNSAENSIDTQLQQNDNAINNLDNEINSIYSNVDTMLKKQSSIFDSYNITFGDQLNPDNLTVPVTFTITPKEYSEGLAATLQLNNKNIAMQKNGTSFIVATETFIFDDFQPKVILEQSGVQKIETIEEYYDLQYKYILNINGVFGGNETYSSGKYKYDGDIIMDFVSSEGNGPEKVSIVKYLNGTIVDEQEIDLLDHMVIPVDDNIALSSNDKFSLYAHVQDKYGINYKYILLTYEIDKNGEPINRYPEWSSGSTTEITDKDGNVLYEPSYILGE